MRTSNQFEDRPPEHDIVDRSLNDTPRGSYQVEPRRGGFWKGLITGIAGTSFVWAIATTIMWYTQFRNQPVASQSTTSPFTVAPDSDNLEASQTTPNSAPTELAPLPQSAPVEPNNPTTNATPNVGSAPIAPNETGNQATTNAPQGAIGEIPEATGLNLQQTHPNGTSMRVETVAFGSDNVVVKLVITNGHDNSVSLNFSDSMMLIDNLGTKYPVAAPPSNSNVAVAPQTTAQGEFVFLGRVPSDVKTLTLVTNDGVGGSESNQFTNMPVFRIDIPVQP